MKTELIILICEAMFVYLLVLGAHSMRHRFGPVHFFALNGVGVGPREHAVIKWKTI